MKKRHTENESKMAKDGFLEFYNGGFYYVGIGSLDSQPTWTST